MAAPINSSRLLPLQGNGAASGRQPRNGANDRRFGDFVDSRMSRLHNVRRWDGAARTSYLWDNLRRDPELWDNHGNCYVHLYGQGQSRRGPAFRLPFQLLVEQRCTPLLERFMAGVGPNQMSEEVPRGRQPYRHIHYHQQQQLQQQRRRDHATAQAIPENKTATGTPEQRVELYIPAPPGSDKAQALAYHLATRNFFAWLLRRSLVGEHLGAAFSALLASMRDFRDPEYQYCDGSREGVDNVGDLVAYLDEEGYLDFVGQSNNALAALFLAERFHFRDLYVEAFAHCAGMYEGLYRSSEYQYISPISRRQIRKARTDMDAKLRKASKMLRNFVEDDLSESHLGMTAGARDHLDNFRAFIRRFYTAAFAESAAWSRSGGAGGSGSSSGSKSRSNAILSPQFYRAVRDDFEALYEYLVDERFSVGDSSPLLAQGGLCVLQSVEAFDRRHGHTSLLHPLPLLPEITPSGAYGGGYRGPSPSLPLPLPAPSSPRRRSWLGGRGDKTKLRADGRLVAHAALMRATNVSRVDLLENQLVCAYRKFEEEAVVNPSAPSISGGGGGGGGIGSSGNGSSNGKQSDAKTALFSASSIVDARKVRWILIYCVYQTVRGCALPKESDLRCGDDDVAMTTTQSYHIAIDLDKMQLPWEDNTPRIPVGRWVHSQGTGSPLLVATPGDSLVNNNSNNDDDRDNHSRCRASASKTMEIKPDVDYYALTHRGESVPASARSQVTPSIYSADGVVVIPPRRSSLPRSLSLSRNSTFRLSLGLFRSSSGNASGGAVGNQNSSSGEPTRAKTSAGPVPPSPSSPTLSTRLQRPVTAAARTGGARKSGPLVSPTGSSKKAGPPPPSRRLSTYQEIVVQGYGNGTNHGNVSFGSHSYTPAIAAEEGGDLAIDTAVTTAEETPSATGADEDAGGTQRSPSTASNASSVSDNSSSAATSFATAATTAPSSPLTAEAIIPPVDILPVAATTTTSIKPPAATTTYHQQQPPAELPAELSAAYTTAAAVVRPTTSPALPSLASPLAPTVPTRSPARRSLSANIDTVAEAWSAALPPPLRIQKRMSLNLNTNTNTNTDTSFIDSPSAFGSGRYVDDVEVNDNDNWAVPPINPARHHHHHSHPHPLSAPPLDGLVDVWDQFPELGGHRELKMSGALQGQLRPQTAGRARGY